MRLSYGMSIGEWGNGWEKRCAWFPWRERPEKGGVNSLLILVPVFFRNVVFRDFVGLDLHFVRVVRVLYTFDDVSLVGIPSSSNSSTPSEAACSSPGSPCEFPACPPERAPKPRGSNETVSTTVALPRTLRFFLVAFLGEDLRRVAAIFEAALFLAEDRGRATFLGLSRFLLFFLLAIAGAPHSGWYVYTGVSGEVQRLRGDLTMSPPLNLEFHKLDLERDAPQVYTRHGDRQLKSAWARTSGIDVEDAIALELPGLMRVAADDDMKTSGDRIQVEGVQIMQDIEENLPSFRNGCFWEGAGPVGSIHISTHGDNGRKLSQSGENFRLAHIAGMENQLRTTQGLQRLRPQQSVSIRNQPDARAYGWHGGILMLSCSGTKKLQVVSRDFTLSGCFVGKHAAQRFRSGDGEPHVPKVCFGGEEFHANILLAIAGAVNRNNAALHRLSRMVIDQNHRLLHQHDLFKLKQCPVAIDGLRGGVRGEALARVCFSVDRQGNSQSHP